MIQIKKEYPKDFIVELQGLSPHIVGRITVYFDGACYSCDTDIVTAESGKIYSHVCMKRDLEDEKEAFDQGYHALKMHMKKNNTK